MKAALDFEWPKALRAVRRAAEEGTLDLRPLYPVEVKALCDLVAGAPLSESSRDIAPGMTAIMRTERRDNDGMKESRIAYYFVNRFSNGRFWQCSLFSPWIWDGSPHSHFYKVAAFSAKNIAQAVTRSGKARSSAANTPRSIAPTSEGG